MLRMQEKQAHHVNENFFLKFTDLMWFLKLTTKESMEKVFNKEDTDFKIEIQPNLALAQNYFDIDDYYQNSFRR